VKARLGWTIQPPTLDDAVAVTEPGVVYIPPSIIKGL
jgi:hypothetical protein